MKTTYFILIFFMSFLISIIVMPLRGITISDDIPGVYLCSILGFVFYFFATLFLTNKYRDTLSFRGVTVAILLGFCVFQVPLRVIDFRGTLISLPDCLMHFMGIIGGIASFFVGKRTKKILFILGLSVCLFMLFQGYNCWYNKLNFGTFTGKTEVVLSLDMKFTNEQGAEVSLREMRGKYVIMDFWYAQCGGCFKAMPKVQKLYDALGNHPRAALYAVNAKLESDSESFAFTRLKGLGFSLPTLRIDMKDPVLQQLGIKAYPTVLIFNPDGNVVFRGNIENAKTFIENLLNQEEK